MKVGALFLLFAFIGCSSSALITFNVSFLELDNCYTGCSFSEPLLWDNQVVPSTNDSILINLPLDYPTIVIIDLHGTDTNAVH